MTCSYNRSSRREQDKILQVTCDAVVEAEFLAAIRREKIAKLPASYEQMKLTPHHPARGDERQRLEANHPRKVVLKW